MIGLRFLRQLVVVLAVTGVCVWAVTRWVAVPWVVSGPSMEPTLREGDRVIVDLLGRGTRAPRPGEVVVILGPEDIVLVKRVARDGAIDGLPAALVPASSPLEPTFVVLGDNREASSDSRSFGPIPLHRIRGRVVWRYWPLSRFGPIRETSRIGTLPPDGR